MHFLRFLGAKSQVAAFMVLIVVVIILAIGATMLIGEVGFQKIRLMNTVDAAVISSATMLARSLNLVKQTNYRLLLNHARLQVMLVARGVWTHKAEAWAYSVSYVEGIVTAQKLFEQAEKIVENVPKDIRVGLHERILGGLVDEVKPYHMVSERLDWDRYLREPNAFTFNFRAFKKGAIQSDEGGTAYGAEFVGNPLAGKDHWYFNNVLSYSWNKKAKWNKKANCINTSATDGCWEWKFDTGTLIAGGDPELTTEGRPYDCYLREELVNPPQSISIRPAHMILFFLYYCGTSVCPGFLYNPYAWISRITVSPGGAFGADVRKMPFRRFPYFIPEGSMREISHSARATVSGNQWTGYDIKLTE